MLVVYAYFYQILWETHRDIILVTILLGLVYYLFYKFMIKPFFTHPVKNDRLKQDRINHHEIMMGYARESAYLSHQIADWLKNNISDGDLISKLRDPELVALFKKDQELYLKIRDTDPTYLNPDSIEPMELYNFMIELAQGKFPKTH